MGQVSFLSTREVGPGEENLIIIAKNK